MNSAVDMGRTVPSFRMLLEGIIADLSVFKRALRGEDKVAFDSIMNKARAHASSCTVAPLLDHDSTYSFLEIVPDSKAA